VFFKRSGSPTQLPLLPPLIVSEMSLIIAGFAPVIINCLFSGGNATFKRLRRVDEKMHRAAAAHDYEASRPHAEDQVDPRRKKR
jgi:hypothetical protein